MKLIAISLLFSISIKYSLANCIIEGYSDGTINNKVPVKDTDTDPDKPFISIPVQNVVGVEIVNPSSYKYVDVKYEDNQLHFGPSAAFADFEKDTGFLQFPTVSTQIKLTCADSTTSDWIFHQTITDTNNHKPTFNKNSYTFSLPMPFPGGLALTEFGENLLVTDIDISNSRIDFEIEEAEGRSLLYVDYVGTNDDKQKEHIGVVRTKTPLKLTGPVTFTVKATDAGIPSESTTATITIEIDPNGSLPTSPQFEKGYYTATYDNVGDQHSISSTAIPVTEGVTEENIQLSGGYENYFQYVVQSNQLKITLKNNLPADVIADEPFVALSISASIENAETTATTSLIISMPSTIKAEFDKVFYQTEYKNEGDKHSITDVTIGVTNGAIVTLGGDFKDNFLYNSDTKTISLKENLEDNIITNRQYIDVTIKAEMGSTLTETVLIVSMPTEIKVQFDQVLYTAEYNNEETQHTIGAVEIKVTEGATVTLEGVYTDYFRYNAADKTITSENNLPENVITSLLYVDVTIKATIGFNVAEAVLIVSMPDESIINFNRVFYHSVYNDENTDHEISSVIIDVTEGADIVLDGDYKDYFEYVEATKAIVLVRNLPIDTINSLSYVDVTIKGTVGSSTAEAVLIVSMPERANVKFNTVLYKTNYYNEDNHVIDPVVIEVSDGAVITLEGEYKDYFQYTEGTKTITLVENLPENTINSLDYIDVTITATIKSAVAEAIMIVSMPGKDNVRFDQVLYKTMYDNEGTNHTITPVVIGVTEGATISLEGEYKDYFLYNDADKTITLASELPEDTITSLYFIDVTIKATMVSSVAEATLIVSMPGKVNLKFDQVLYKTVYDNEGANHAITPVVIGVTEGAAITLEGEYKDHFLYNSADKTITLASELPEDTITSLYFIDVTIKATMGSSIAEATLIVSMPGKVNLKFDQVLYKTVYDNEGATHTIAPVVIGVTEGAAITLEGEYKDHFLYNTADKTITLASELPEGTISSLYFIDVTIKATMGSSVAEATLIVSMPGKVNLRFDQVLYKTVYDNEGATHTITPVVIGVTEGAAITLEGEYKDHFLYNTADKTITLASELPEATISSLYFIDVTIKATMGSSVAEATLIVSMPGKVNLRFDQVLYKTVYDNEGATHTITPVVIGVTEGAAITLEGEYKDHFLYNNADKTITLASELPEATISSLYFIDVTIKATMGSSVAEATLIVSMPGKVNLMFDQVLYKTVYDNEGATHTIIPVVIGVTEGAAITLEGEYKDHFLYNDVDKTITLASELPEGTISSLYFIDVTIKATMGSSVAEATLIVSMPGKVNLKFDQVLYKTVYDNEGAIHAITPVVIGVTEGAAITLEGEYKDHFLYNDADKTITLASELPEATISSLYFIDVTIKATMGSSVAEATMIVSMPGKVSLRFDQVLYKTAYDNEGATHEITPVVIGVTEGATISLEGEYKDNFHYNEADKTITLSSELPEDTISSLYYIDVTIKATMGSSVAEAVMIVSMPGKVNLRFDQVLHEAIYNYGEATHEITPVEVGVTEGAVITLAGDQKDYFEYKDVEKTIVLKENLPDSLITSLHYIDIRIIATIQSSTEEAVLIVSIPCQGTIPPAAVITFTDEYIFKMEPSESIDVQVTATSTIEEEITYELKGKVPREVVLSPNGHLQTIDLPTGFYDLEIVATGSTSKATATAPLKISIATAEICNGEIIVSHAFLAKAIEEEQEDNVEILPKHDAYYYEVENVDPRTDRIDVSSEGTVVAKTLDRESDEFTGGRPQYIATIRLVPNTQQRYSVSSSIDYRKSLFNPKQNRAMSEDDQCYMVTDIRFDPTLVTIGVIVEDINDNKPEFADDEIIIGYPEKDLLTVVAPAYLLKVEATDKDTGIRASLEYTLDTDKVVIDPKTGYIYPTAKIYDIDEPIAVTATDEDGQGLSSDKLSITVKFLKEKHLSILSFANKHLGNLDDIMENLKNYADVRYLSASVLPKAINRYKRDDDSNDKSLVLVAYAFDFAKQLLTAEELKESLNGVDGLTIESLSNTGGDNRDDDDSSNTGLIIAVSVLAVLLALCLIGFIAFYFLKVRKSKSYNKMDEDGYSKNVTKNSALETPRFTKNSGPTASTKSDIDVTTRRPTGYILQSELAEEKPSSPTSTPSAPSEAMNEELRERRKSVVFNSNVEEINIEREADDQDGEKRVASDNSQTNNTNKY